MPFTPPSWNWSIGTLIALVVLVLCIVFIAIGQALTPLAVLLFIAALALARLT